MAEYYFSIVSPTAATVVGRTVTVTATASSGGFERFPRYRTDSVSVEFGAGEPTVSATNGGGTEWQATGTLPAGTTGGAQVVLTALAYAVRIENHGTPENPELVENPFVEYSRVTVVAETSLPQVGFDPYPRDVTASSLPYKLRLTGTAVDVGFSGVASVQVGVVGGSMDVAQNLSGDWRRWAIDLMLGVGDQFLRANATDNFGNVGSWQDTITVKAAIEGPVEQAFAITSYLREILGMASRYVRLDGASTGPSIAELGGWLRQPLTRLIEAIEFIPATAEVAQARVAVEVLRGVLQPPAPLQLDQRYRARAYEVLLRDLGTSSEELRLTRTADDRTRQALAGQLGLQSSRLDRLDAITLSPDAITDSQLEELFGYRSTNPSDPLATLAPAAVLLWQQEALRASWLRADAAERDGRNGPVPVIDPDVIVKGHVRTQDQADLAHQLWTQRRAWIQDRLVEISDVLSQVGATASSFDSALRQSGLIIDLPALAGRDREGADIAVELAALGLTLDAFRYLVRIRTLVTAGTVTASEWQDVASILVQARKRQVFGTWRREEHQSGIVLQPGAFIAHSAEDPVAFTGMLRWRADWATLARWRRTLIARQRQAEATDAGYRAVIDAAEQEVLPALRDALIAEIGRRRTPPQSSEQTAERLSRELSLDFRAAAGTRTTRVGQAVDSLQSLLVSVRSGRLSTVAGGGTAAVDDEASFDLEWAWLETYSRWRSAMEAFAYPENRLLPSLFVKEFVATDRELSPTKAFVTFLSGEGQKLGLLDISRLTPDAAQALAEAYLAQVKNETGTVEVLKDVKLTNLRSNAELDNYRNLCAQLASGSPGQPYTEERRIPQHLREIFWLVPIALARKLHDCGQYTAALDWYQTVFAYQLPTGRRVIYHGLKLEQDTQSTFGRDEKWLPVVKELNPHFTARHRKGAYTRFTLMSIVECFLAFADSEFAGNAPDSNARARALYQTAIDLLDLLEVIPEAGPFPVNPVWLSLKARADTGLSKIHAGLNIAGQTDLTLADINNVLPSVYRYSVVVERAKTLVAIAQQVESAYLSALERADGANYDLLRAGHDLHVAQVALAAQDLRVDAAVNDVQQAELQRDRAQIQFGAYDEWISDGLNGYEQAGLAAMRTALYLQTAAAVNFGAQAVADTVKGIATLGIWGDAGGSVGQSLSAFAGAASLGGQIAQAVAGYERREQEWRLNRNLADKDVQLAEGQIAGAQNQHRIAELEFRAAANQLDHARLVAEFLATKFTNAELYEWMSGVLARVYAFFLQQATAVAQLAQAQLAFERQEPVNSFIAADYWQPAPDREAGVTEPAADRRGITGSARLLQDIFRLDQQAFDTDRRKLHLTHTVAVSQIAAFELQRFRQTGVLTFATPQELFDRDFPGQYLRLTKRVKLSLIALIPPVRGLRATLSASGVSRAVVARGSFDTVTLRREPEAIAFTAPVGATGLFEFEPEGGMLLPFEGMGVDTVWQLSLPKAANPFDYRSIADVLLTIEYTALDSPEYRQKVIRSLDRTFSGDRSFSLRNQFPDAWYELNNPDTIEDPARRMRAVLPLTADDFPPHIADLAVAQLTLFAVRDNALTDELTITVLRHTTAGQTTEAGQVRTFGGIVGTRRPGGVPWQVFVGAGPTGDWELQFEDTPVARSWFTDGLIQDLVLVMTLSGTTPEWP